mmetsp:Transcript_19979/g.58365  ORF Transcript_19979/g.58365 Transcript_19979/m.58365 type:complete len:87 (+) Transcript_19979:1776-2036(+)
MAPPLQENRLVQISLGLVATRSLDTRGVGRRVLELTDQLKSPQASEGNRKGEAQEMYDELAMVLLAEVRAGGVGKTPKSRSSLWWW